MSRVEMICDLEKAFARGKTVCIVEKNGVATVKTLSLTKRIWHWRDRAFHSKRLDKIACEVAKVLSVKERLPLADVHDDSTVKLARRLKKQIAENAKNGLKGSKEEVNKKLDARLKTMKGTQELIKEFAAIHLGIKSEIFDANKGFQSFAEKTHLSQYLLVYGHNVSLDDAKVLLRKEGKLAPWSQLQEEIKAWAPNKNKPKMPWIYGQEGIQNKDMYDWTTLEPYKIEDPAAWNYKYVFEFCLCKNPDSELVGNNSWIRLKTPTGQIYSVGLYAPDKQGLKNTGIKDLPYILSYKPGNIMSPELSEFWDFEIRRSAHEITEKQFCAMKKSIEDEKQIERDRGLIYHQYNTNCVQWCTKIAAIGGIKFQTGESTPKTLLPKKAYSKFAAAFEKMPRIIQKICNFVTTFFVNIWQYILGANRTHKVLNKHQISCAKEKKHFKSWKDFFEYSKSEMHHPSQFFYKLKPAHNNGVIHA
jgi:hypothetical protein